MTEDESFIRAIVDTPGDDTARLVYADWLDDRDDPRGTYLRAEHEWAKPWRNGERPQPSAELHELGSQLDAVWVARVSRPPVGVCCEHLRFKSSDGAVTAQDLDSLEERLKLTLPIQLRAMLLNYNGGKPIPGSYRARWRRPTDSPDAIARFFSVFVSSTMDNPKAKTSSQEMSAIEYTTKVLNNGFVSRQTNTIAYEKWTSGVRTDVALAEPAGGLGVLAIGLVAKRAGKVYEYNRTLVAASSSPKLLADSLAQFLATITIAS